MKKLLLILTPILFAISLNSQKQDAVRTTDWNTAQKAGFYDGLSAPESNLPIILNDHWTGIIFPSSVKNTPKLIKGQLVIQSRSYPVNAYIRATHDDGTGKWARLLHDQGDHKMNGNLEVNGKIRTKEVKIENVNWWSDFVFDKSYKLPALSEVEDFISQNKHLPDIPSEKDVKENGINIIEMQAKLLQKIEELTLYVINQEKRIEQQDKIIEELRNK